MLEVVALLVCVAIVAATVGASVTVAILFKHKSADDAHLETLLAPIRTDVVELHDNIESWGRRIDKRARDARRSSSSDDQPPLKGTTPTEWPVEPATTRERMMALAKRLHRGIPG